VPLVRHLDALRRHGEWADTRLLEALRSAPRPVPEALRELAHVRGAQEIWLSRIEGRPASLAVWPDLSLDDLAHVGPSLDIAMRRLIDSTTAGALDRMVSYTNTAGLKFSTPLGEIVLHMLMHGQYHRGKANAALRAGGAQPASVDYIAWQRTLTAG
jgi:uncharacterized damage-inducible protein DinB